MKATWLSRIFVARGLPLVAAFHASIALGRAAFISSAEKRMTSQPLALYFSSTIASFTRMCWRSEPEISRADTASAALKSAGSLS